MGPLRIHLECVFLARGHGTSVEVSETFTVLMPKRTQLLLVGCLQAANLSGAAELSAGGLHWEKLPPLPNRGGLGSPYAGVSNGKLLVAGGANFPQSPPWEGGKKRLV